MRIGYFLSTMKTEFDEEIFLKSVSEIQQEDKLTIEIGKIERFPFEKEYDLVICLGDDSVLTLIQETDVKIPILCIELPGDNSFFSQSTLNDFGDKLLKINYNLSRTETRTMLKIEYSNEVSYALNDLYLSSIEPNTRLRYDLIVDDSSLFDNPESSNGLVISTPTGSTAMAMNLGGPLIQYDADVFQIQAIAPRNLYASHYIISGNSHVLIDVIEVLQPLIIQIDNRRIKKKVNQIKVTKADRVVQFVKFDKDQDDNISNKLLNKISFEDTASLTSSAKFILHILQTQDRELTVNEIADITRIENPKTLRNSLNLLMKKGFVKRKANLTDLREHLYSYNEFQD